MLVRARATLGDATSAEIPDAETTLPLAQQVYLNSIYNYLTALARLEYSHEQPASSKIRFAGSEPTIYTERLQGSDNR